MKIKNYIDCVNLSDNGWKAEQLQDLKNVIIAHLPTKRILEVASVLMVRLADDSVYLIKNRKGNEEIEGIDFKVIAVPDYADCNSHLDRMYRTMELLNAEKAFLYEMKEWRYDENYGFVES